MARVYRYFQWYHEDGGSGPAADSTPALPIRKTQRKRGGYTTSQAGVLLWFDIWAGWLDGLYVCGIRSDQKDSRMALVRRFVFVPAIFAGLAADYITENPASWVFGNAPYMIYARETCAHDDVHVRHNTTIYVRTEH